jgi:hypothetical protein
VPEVTVKTLAITMPVPAGLGGGGSVHVMGGTFTGTGTIAGDVVTVSLTAGPGVTTKTMAVPELMIPLEVPLSAAGTTLAFAGPSKLDLALDLAGTPIDESCTADAGNPPLLTTVVAGTPGPVTTMPSMTTVPTATTATTAPVATTRPPVATTRPPVTTTKPSTGPTTTRPAGGTGPGGGPRPVVATPTYTG